MRNEELWRPSKFVATAQGLAASRDTAMIALQSRIPGDLVAAFLDRAIREHATGRLLDLGCGTVPLYGAYRPHVEEVTCVDWSNSAHRIDHIDVEHDLSRPLPFADGRFDTILLSDVLEHLAEPASLWSEMKRVLAPNGVVILNVPFLYWLHETPHDFYRYTEFALRRFSEQAGMEVVELARLGGAAEVLTDVACKAIRPYRFSRTASRMLQAGCRRFGRTGVGGRFRERTGRKMPLGYGMVARRP